jgi:hypothetical protein
MPSCETGYKAGIPISCRLRKPIVPGNEIASLLQAPELGWLSMGMRICSKEAMIKPEWECCRDVRSCTEALDP